MWVRQRRESRWNGIHERRKTRNPSHWDEDRRWAGMKIISDEFHCLEKVVLIGFFLSFQFRKERQSSWFKLKKRERRLTHEMGKFSYHNWAVNCVIALIVADRLGLWIDCTTHNISKKSLHTHIPFDSSFWRIQTYCRGLFSRDDYDEITSRLEHETWECFAPTIRWIRKASLNKTEQWWWEISGCIEWMLCWMRLHSIHPEQLKAFIDVSR